MTTTIELDLHTRRVKMHQRAKYLGQTSFCSKVITRTHRQTHRQTQ